MTSPVQTLLYRYAGNDRNPLHSEPETAHKHGFREPILMGQNTLGYACRAIVHALADGDPSRVRSIAGRFAAAGYNGDTLVTEMWHGADVGCDDRGDTVVALPRREPARRRARRPWAGHRQPHRPRPYQAFDW